MSLPLTGVVPWATGAQNKITGIIPCRPPSLCSISLVPCLLPMVLSTTGRPSLLHHPRRRRRRCGPMAHLLPRLHPLHLHRCRQPHRRHCQGPRVPRVACMLGPWGWGGSRVGHGAAQRHNNEKNETEPQRLRFGVGQPLTRPAPVASRPVPCTRPHAATDLPSALALSWYSPGWSPPCQWQCCAVLW